MLYRVAIRAVSLVRPVPLYMPFVCAVWFVKEQIKIQWRFQELTEGGARGDLEACPQV